MAAVNPQRALPYKRPMRTSGTVIRLPRKIGAQTIKVEIGTGNSLRKTHENACRAPCLLRIG